MSSHSPPETLLTSTRFLGFKILHCFATLTAVNKLSPNFVKSDLTMTQTCHHHRPNVCILQVINGSGSVTLELVTHDKKSQELKIGLDGRPWKWNYVVQMCPSSKLVVGTCNDTIACPMSRIFVTTDTWLCVFVQDFIKIVWYLKKLLVGIKITWLGVTKWLNYFWRSLHVDFNTISWCIECNDSHSLKFGGELESLCNSKAILMLDVFKIMLILAGCERWQ